MKFDYKEFETTNEFDLRWYLLDHTSYPSITSMLGATQSDEARDSLKNWALRIGQEKANQIGQDAATNGTAVHLLIETFLKNQPINLQDFTEYQIKLFTSIKGYLKKINEVWGQEVVLFSDKLKIAGRCDCIGIYKNVPCIIDFKTSLKIKNDSMIEDYKYQLAFYAQAHNEMFGTSIERGIILMTTKDGFPLEFCIDLNKYYDKLETRVSKFYEILLK